MRECHVIPSTSGLVASHITSKMGESISTALVTPSPFILAPQIRPRTVGAGDVAGSLAPGTGLLLSRALGLPCFDVLSGVAAGTTGQDAQQLELLQAIAVGFQRQAVAYGGSRASLRGVQSYARTARPADARSRRCPLCRPFDTVTLRGMPALLSASDARVRDFSVRACVCVFVASACKVI